jgi:hypothetical protein
MKNMMVQNNVFLFILIYCGQKYQHGCYENFLFDVIVTYAV